MSEDTQPQIMMSAPYFHVVDVVKAAGYYRDVLGFVSERLWGEPPCFAIPRRDGFAVMLSQVCEAEQVVPNGKLTGEMESWDAYFWVRDAEALFAEFTAKGAVVVYPPKIQQYYDMKEFAVRDLDGFVLAFGQHWPKS